MDRREFAKYSGTAFLGSFLFGACNKFDEEIEFVIPKCNSPREAQSSEKPESFRIIMNNDGNDGFNERFTNNYSNEVDFLNLRTTPLAISSQVDAIFYCTGTTHLFSHRTSIGENFDNGFANKLYGRGTDPFQLVIDHVHDYSKKVFFSLRMNDTHDSTVPHLYTKWKSRNSKYLMGSEGDIFQYGGNRWSAMNYDFSVVREYLFSICEEVIENYDIDGLELDFFRHPIFFRNQLFGEDAESDQIELMNDLVRRISKLAHYKNVQLAVRIPDSLTICYKIGLDVNSWLCSRWVDITTLSGYFHLEPWANIKLLKEVFNTQVYACLSSSRLKYFDNRILPEEFWRGEGILAKEAGADGLYFFNVFNPDNPLFYEFGDIAAMKSKFNRKIENEGYYHNYWIKDCGNYSQL